MDKSKRGEMLDLFRLALKQYRAASGDSQDKLAKSLDMNLITYQRLETGNRNPGTETGPIMASYFQSIGTSAADDVVHSLLQLGGFDVQKLHQQLESAAWRWSSELPDVHGVTPKVLVIIWSSMLGQRHIQTGHYNPNKGFIMLGDDEPPLLFVPFAWQYQDSILEFLKIPEATQGDDSE